MAWFESKKIIDEKTTFTTNSQNISFLIGIVPYMICHLNSLYDTVVRMSWFTMIFSWF